MSRNVTIISLGCAKNSIDSELMAGILVNNGFFYVEDPARADVIIINTCGFITPAKEESIDTILDVSRLKEGKSKPYILVAGCLSQRYGKELLDEMPEIDGIIGTGEIENIAGVLTKILNGQRVLQKGNIKCLIEDHRIRYRLDTSPTAYVKIAEGCSNYCSYCIIPYLRGPYRSRPLESIIKEVEELSQNGAKEIILVAQETTRYGRDLYGDYKLAGLLKQLVRIEGIEWIRLLYCYASGITSELIEVIAREEKICSYIDIPIQHASNNVLKYMNRRESKEQIKQLISRLRTHIPGLTLRTTFMVGFPGETEDDFKELLNFIEETRFERAGVFTYSCEEGTPAAKLQDQVPDYIKEERRQEIMLLQQNISLENNLAKIGKVQEVLVEGFEEDCNMYVGRTRADAPEVDGQVYFHSSKTLPPGNIVPVEITGADEYDLTGELIHELA